VKTKIYTISKILLSLIVIINIILISTLIIFDISGLKATVVFDIFVCFVLLADFFSGFFKSSNKSEYFKENFLEFVAAIPFDLMLSPFLGLNYLRFIRFLRVLLLIALYFKIVGEFLKNTHLDEILGVFILVVIGSTLGLYLIDPSMNNLFDDLWFVVVSLTTVGYGDITPSTVFGKVFSLILLLIGVFIFSAITGAISSYFMDNLLQEGSYHIHELKDNVRKSEMELQKVNGQLEKNEKKIDELKNEIAELKEIIKKNS
jgi:hypothetical protein